MRLGNRWQHFSAALFAAAAAALTPASARAHVGSPDVFFEGNAGPYRLLVTIRPPEVVPGVADIQLRSDSDAVREIRIAPVPLAANAERFSPTPDIASRSNDE